MGRTWGRPLLIAAAATAALLVGAGGAAAGTTPPVFPIPGLSGRALTVAGVQRLDDGGALIASSTRAGARAPWRLTSTRLLVDGAVDLAYGAAGNELVGTGIATAVAIDPRSGAAWIGAATSAGRGEIVALDPGGARRRGFGSGGVLRLGSAPVAIALRAGALVVAAGNQPCPGCDLQMLDPSSGETRATGELGAQPSGQPATTPGASGTSTCVPGAITSLAVVPGQLLAATLGASGCPAQLLSIDAGGGSLSTGATVGLTGLQEALVASAGGQACVGATSPGHAAVGPTGSPGALALVPAGHIVAVVGLGAGACAALISPGHGHRALVAQAASGARHATVDALPRGVQPLGMSRCEQHLLVIGARSAPGHQRDGLVAVLPVRTGPYAHARMHAALAAVARCGEVP